MTTRPWRPIAMLGAAVAALAALASGAGVFLRGDLETTEIVTPRGETVDMLVGGVYRWNSVNVAAEGVGWDVVTLFIVVPAFILLLPAVARGSLRAILAATGALVYFLYQYFEYATYLAYGPLFLLYVATFALSLATIVLIVAQLPLDEVAARFTGTFPRRGVAAFGVFMAVLLAGMWLPLIAATAGGDVDGHLYGATTLVVQAFDLGLLVPLGLFTAIAAWRRHPAGFVLAAVVVVKGFAMGSAIAAMLVFEAVATGDLQVVPIVGFALIALASIGLGWRVFGSIEGEARLPARRAAGSAPIAA